MQSSRQRATYISIMTYVATLWYIILYNLIHYNIIFFNLVDFNSHDVHVFVSPTNYVENVGHERSYLNDTNCAKETTGRW